MGKGTLAALIVIATLTGTVPTERRTPASIRTIAWLQGCWQQQNSRRVTDEQWMAPLGGLMMGMSRTVRGDTVADYEVLRIRETGGVVVYHAEPSGQSPTDFTATVLTDSSATFENLAHDFPQRVIYRRRGADSLVARIEGMRNGQLRGVDFPSRRVSCTPWRPTIGRARRTDVHAGFVARTNAAITLPAMASR